MCFHTGTCEKQTSVVCNDTVILHSYRFIDDTWLERDVAPW